MDNKPKRRSKRRRTNPAPDSSTAPATPAADGAPIGNANPSTIDPDDAMSAGASSSAKARRAPRGTGCWICLDGLPDDSGARPFHAGCACRGGAGFAHPLCKVQSGRSHVNITHDERWPVFSTEFPRVCMCVEVPSPLPPINKHGSARAWLDGAGLPLLLSFRIRSSPLTRGHCPLLSLARSVAPLPTHVSSSHPPLPPAPARAAVCIHSVH